MCRLQISTSRRYYISKIQHKIGFHGKELLEIIFTPTPHHIE